MAPLTAAYTSLQHLPLRQCVASLHPGDLRRICGERVHGHPLHDLSWRHARYASVNAKRLTSRTRAATGRQGSCDHICADTLRLNVMMGAVFMRQLSPAMLGQRRSRWSGARATSRALTSTRTTPFDSPQTRVKQGAFFSDAASRIGLISRPCSNRPSTR